MYLWSRICLYAQSIAEMEKKVNNSQNHTTGSDVIYRGNHNRRVYSAAYGTAVYEIDLSFT